MAKETIDRIREAEKEAAQAVLDASREADALAAGAQKEAESLSGDIVKQGEIEAITKQARSKMPEAIDSVLRAITE